MCEQDKRYEPSIEDQIEELDEAIKNMELDIKDMKWEREKLQEKLGDLYRNNEPSLSSEERQW